MSVDERFPLTSERIMLAVDRLVNAQISQRLCNGGGVHASPYTLQQIADEVRAARANLTMALDEVVPSRGTVGLSGATHD
jgi:hypothetical protein